MARGYVYGDDCLSLEEYHPIQYQKFLQSFEDNPDCSLYSWNRSSYGGMEDGFPVGFGFRATCNGSTTGVGYVGYADGSEACEIEVAPAPNDPATIDYAQSAEFWAFAFTTIMAFYLVAKNIGLILEAVKKW